MKITSTLKTLNNNYIIFLIKFTKLLTFKYTGCFLRYVPKCKDLNPITNEELMAKLMLAVMDITTHSSIYENTVGGTHISRQRPFML